MQKTMIFPRKARLAIAKFLADEKTKQIVEDPAFEQALVQAAEEVRMWGAQRRAELVIRPEILHERTRV